MNTVDRPRAARVSRTAIGSVLVAALLVLATASPALAAPPKLVDATVSPRSGTTATTIVFEVRYERPWAPEWIHVRVGGTPYPMSRVGSGDWVPGSLFRYAGKLPVGSHSVVFQASGVRDLAAGNVAIS